VCWTSRFAPLLHSVPLGQTQSLGIQGKLVSITGSCTSGFFGSHELDDTVSTGVHETFGMVISVHYPLQFHVIQSQVAYITYHMNVADITISLICKPLNRSFDNYLIETQILTVSFPSCWVSTVKQNFNPNLCAKIKSKGPINGLTAPNKNDGLSACKTVL